MAERLCQEIAQFLAERDEQTDDQPAAGFAHARLAVSLAEGLDGKVGGPRDHATAVDDPGRLAAFLDQGLPRPERNAVVAALANDAMRRAEASSAAAFLDDIDRACPPLPAGLVARTVETLGRQAFPQKGQTVEQDRWSRLRPLLGGLRPSLVGLVLVGVLTPVVLSLILHERDASVRDIRNGPIERSFAPLPGAGKSTPLDRSTGEPAAHSCEPSAKAAGGNQPTADRHDAEPDATKPAGGDAKKPEERGTAQTPGISVDDPCRPERSVEGSIRSPTGARK